MECVVFFEFSLRGHKPAKTLQLKNQLLTLLIPAASVVGRPSRASVGSPTPWAPSESASEAQLQSWFEKHLPSASIGDRSTVKRIVIEAQTIVVAELREQVSSSLEGGGPGVGNGLPQETAFCRKRPAVGNSLYQETAETILRHLFRKK